VEQLSYGDDAIPLASGETDNLRQRVRREAAVVVKKDDSAGVELAGVASHEF